MRSLFFLFFFVELTFAQNIIQSKPKQINLYPSGAQVIRSFNVDLQKGNNEITLNGISNEINAESIQFQLADSKLSISGLNYQTSFLEDSTLTQAHHKISVDNNRVYNEKKLLNIELLVLKREENILLENQKVGGSYSGMKPEDLISTIDFFKERMNQVLFSQEKIKSKIDSLDILIKENFKTLNELNNTLTNRLSEVNLSIYSPENIRNKEIQFSYFTSNAGWYPIYDFKANDLSEPITVLFKAEVFQYSGENWEDVDLVLNNLLPKGNSNVPELRKWIWGQPNDYSDYLNNVLTQTKSKSSISGIVTDEDGLVLPGVSITLNGTSLGTISDHDGVYRFNLPPDRRTKTNELTFSYIGFKPKSINFNEIPEKIVLEFDLQKMEEIVVVGYSAQKKTSSLSSALSGKVAGVNVGKELKRLISEEEAPSTVQFKLNNKTTIPSNGKSSSLELKEIQIPAIYEHVSVPKIDPTVYVSAKIIGWEQYNFLPGKASLYLEGTYLGNADLKLPNSDTLVISLGRDTGIKVERKNVWSLTKNQILGGNIIETFKYEINVRNNKGRSINLKLIDQYPISTNKDVTIFDKEAIDSKTDENTGEVIWERIIDPKSNSTFPFTYTVKYPKTGYILE